METNRKRFALLGAAGYIAPRHIMAIKETENELVAAFDLSDSVGILDSYFPNALFFKEYELFDRHLSVQRQQGVPIDFVSVCTPNYLHDSHIRLGLRLGADVICEKPLVLDPSHLEALIVLQKETGKKVYNILQLRLHPAIIALKQRIESGPKDKIYDVDITYITSRGNWYFASWKGDDLKSGGLATNIGVHFFDMLGWVFGPHKRNVVHLRTPDRVAGFLELERARVRYFLSVDYQAIPPEAKALGKRTFRSLTMENEAIEFSDGFTDLHTQSYRHILSGRGFGLEQATHSLQIVHDIRHATPIGAKGDYHYLL
ncbi:MAG: Gfo/Idh/MocA family oxidoreductase [Prevotellaceae bacterium]|jgi:UDP-N-acetyl-2-amino-2-deoxyglucuronate dehydrogenase|nr:Gfo/Idh/MocA family oxidoreductase [Prevotellaceae bacterium]